MKAIYRIVPCSHLLGLFTSLLLLTGCVSLPEELQLPPEQALVSFGKVIQAPDKYVGKMVRWGGVIAEVRNKADHSIIEVAYYPIASSGRPKVDEAYSAGRFRAKVAGLADPMVYQQGKAITFVGPLSEPVESKIDEFTYKFPVVLVEQFVLWKELPDYDERYYHNHWPYHRYPFPYYRPYSWYDDPWPHHSSKRGSSKKTKKIKKPIKQPNE